MEIFNNRDRPNYEEIVSYGPRWLTEYREMDANYRYAGWTLDLAAYWLERIVKNQFPSQADEQTITMLEKLLHIETDATQTLEERRRTVIAHYYGLGKLSKSAIISIIRSYSGYDSDVWWDGAILKIKINCEKEGEFSDEKIMDIIRRRLPAHIPLSMYISIERTFRQLLKIGAGGATLVRLSGVPIGENRRSKLAVPVGYSQFLLPEIKGASPKVQCASTARIGGSAGMHYHTHIKSKLIG